MGCFQDNVNANRDLPYEPYSDDTTMTIEFCLLTCANAGYTYVFLCPIPLMPFLYERKIDYSSDSFFIYFIANAKILQEIAIPGDSYDSCAKRHKNHMKILARNHDANDKTGILFIAIIIAFILAVDNIIYYNFTALKFNQQICWSTIFSAMVCHQVIDLN
jgi:hypothetical protein